MTTLDAGILTTVLLAIVGCYAYVHREIKDMKKEQKELEDCVEGTLKEHTKALNQLALAVTNRLQAIETQLEIQLPKKGRGDSRSQ